jgi:hypothetical protein
MLAVTVPFLVLILEVVQVVGPVKLVLTEQEVREVKVGMGIHLLLADQA